MSLLEERWETIIDYCNKTGETPEHILEEARKIISRVRNSNNTE